MTKKFLPMMVVAALVGGSLAGCASEPVKAPAAPASADDALKAENARLKSDVDALRKQLADMKSSNEKGKKVMKKGAKK